MYTRKGMKIKELIHHLQNFDQEAEVTLRMSDMFIDTSELPWKTSENLIITMSTQTSEFLDQQSLFRAQQQHALRQFMNGQALQQQPIGLLGTLGGTLGSLLGR